MDVRFTGYGAFRGHLRARHRITRISPEDANRYRCDGGVHITQNMRNAMELERLREENQALHSSTGVHLSANDFVNVMNSVQQTINTGVERGMATAFNASSAINFYASVQSSSAVRNVQAVSNRGFVVTTSNESYGRPIIGPSITQDGDDGIVVPGSSNNQIQPDDRKCGHLNCVLIIKF